ncbi:NAD(P)H-dependent oxidoreductase [Tepidiforma sp.]|uniref:flavodoxin family protein n=1 Tax=Tepidiforma sp. TaxID=2682230 RepID=UPI002ADE6F79|nr:NAD(P)H-dependent oxidoreductase [Tepidiforma sp.]
MVRILLLYDSRGGLTARLADAVEAGIRSAGGACLRRTVEAATPADLLACDGLIVGSPNWSGITGRLKEWFDASGDLWETGELAGRPAGAFTAGLSRSAGTEATLLQLLHLLLSHGMVVVGLPWSERMQRSGSYYGATAHGEVTADDEAQASLLGARVTDIARRLRPSRR